MNIEELLVDIPDKPQETKTTSHSFKKDVWEFCSQPIFKELDVLECGSYIGQTTRILSFLFKNVISVNNIQSGLDRSKTLNEDRTNIKYECVDLYSPGGYPKEWKADVVFVDAMHTYDAVKSDIENALKLESTLEKKIFIFDDYGIGRYQNDVRRAVDEFVENGTLEVISYVGYEPGFSIDGTPERTMQHYEGIICQEV